MEVCEVCGAFLIVGDSQTRVDDHLMGKQHMGFAKIKATIEEIKVGYISCVTIAALSNLHYHAHFTIGLIANGVKRGI